MHEIVVDTAWFKGNYPPEVSVEATWVDGSPDEETLQAADWIDDRAEVGRPRRHRATPTGCTTTTRSPMSG